MGIAIFTFDIFFDNSLAGHGSICVYIYMYTSACIYRFLPAILMRRHEPILSTRLVTVSLKFQKMLEKKCNFVGIKVKVLRT